MGGFPEPIARAQRDMMQSDLVDAKRLVNLTVEALQEVEPHNMALVKDEYDLMLACLIQAQSQITLALDQIDNSLARQASAHEQDDLAKAEREE